MKPNIYVGLHCAQFNLQIFVLFPVFNRLECMVRALFNPPLKVKEKKVKQKQGKLWLSRFITLLIGCTFFYVGYAYAGGTGQSLGQVAQTITGSFEGLAKLLTATAYIAGIGFALSAILKFKQHKDNPQQIPIGTPIALLFIAAGLIFLPTIFGVANQTIFGGSGSMGGISGVTQ